LPPLALYVHLPWCARKCPYCDFNSYRSPAGIPEDAYLAALLADLENDLPLTHERALESIFIGGGTPSLFSGSAIRRLIDGIRARLHVPDSVEISLEANPGSAEAGRFAAYRAAGVNRLSIGFQSLRDAPLRALGRVHSAAEALAAFQAARRAGFGNINIDVMYALPDDTVAGALADLEQGLALDPEHVSWYQLTLEPQTAFFRRPPALPPDDAVLDIERQGRQRLAEHGFERYEVSAYARTGRRCRHNLNYWQFGDYLGIGAGAHSKLTMPDDAAILRREKTRNPRGTHAGISHECAAATGRRGQRAVRSPHGPAARHDCGTPRRSATARLDGRRFRAAQADRHGAQLPQCCARAVLSAAPMLRSLRPRTY
jgi:putative oxygen-independent coproporphyrinogen III oxidase